MYRHCMSIDKLRQLLRRLIRAHRDLLMQHSESFPNPLKNLMEDKATELKDLFIARRKEFKDSPKASIDLDAYRRRDNQHDYTFLKDTSDMFSLPSFEYRKGLIPPSLVGKPDIGGGIPYERSDTFFTDFDRHHPNDILSESNDSFIIGNRSSHDVRLYSRDYDPEGQDRSATAGMAYLHLMVIPRERIYNAVSLENTQIIEEMIAHFKTFWGPPDSVKKATDRARRATDSREQEIREGFKKHPDTEVERNAQFTDVFDDIKRSSDEFATKVETLSADDFFFGFHPAPEASVGHLHMHVLPMPVEFRRYSTGVHDRKTVPADIVVEVIRGEKM